MSKTTKVVLIFSSILLLCLIGVGIIIGIYYGNDNRADGLKNIVGSGIEVDEVQMLDLDGASTLHVDCVTGRIDVIESDEAKVTLVGNIWTTEEISNEDLLKVTKSEDVVTASYDIKTKPFSVFNSNVTMTVYLPAEYKLSLSIVSASGDITITGLGFDDLDINSTSGDTTITNCKGSSLKTDKSSGDTKVIYADFESINIYSTSGDVNVSDTAASITLRSSSGSTTLSKVSGPVDIKSTSGRVEVSVDGSAPGPLTIDSISGGVKLYLDSDAAFDVSAKAVSGTINTEFDITITGLNQDFRESVDGIVNGGGNQVNITTTSGGIDLIEK